MVISFPRSNSSCSIIQEWETAGASLVAALTNYVNSSLSLSKNIEHGDTYARSLITQIDSAFEVHSAILSNLSHSGVYLSRTRNKIISPLHRIPEEVLSEIFHCVVYDTRGDEFTSAYSLRWFMEHSLLQVSRRRHNLLNVCSVCRNVILARATFWSTISLNRGYIPTEVLETHLQRARGSKLCLAMTRMPWDIDNQLSTHIPQTHSLTIQAHSEVMISKALSMFLRKDNPGSISELRVQQGRDTTVSPHESEYISIRNSTDEFLPLNTLIESLSILHIDCCYLHWDPSRANNLSTLQLQNIEFNDDEEMVAGLRSISSAPLLRHLELISVDCDCPSDKGITRSPTISFPNLQSLVLDDLYLNVIETVLGDTILGSFHLSLCLTVRSFIHKVNGDHRSLKGLWDFDKHEDPDELKEHSAETLIKNPGIEYVDTLVLWGSQPIMKHGAGLSEMLECMPRLGTLRIHGWKFEEHDWDSLSRFNLRELKEGSSVRELPRLKNLHLTRVDIYDEEGLKEVVRGHRLQLLELGARKRIDPSYTIENPDDFQALSDETISWLLAEVPQLYLFDPHYIPPGFNITRWKVW